MNTLAIIATTVAALLSQEVIVKSSPSAGKYEGVLTVVIDDKGYSYSSNFTITKEGRVSTISLRSAEYDCLVDRVEDGWSITITDLAGTSKTSMTIPFMEKMDRWRSTEVGVVFDDRSRIAVSTPNMAIVRSVAGKSPISGALTYWPKK